MHRRTWRIGICLIVAFLMGIVTPSSPIADASSSVVAQEHSHQQESTDKIPPNPVSILVRHTEQCMNLRRASHDPGALIQQYHCDGTNASIWNVYRFDDGYYEIQSAESFQCVEVRGGWKGNGVPIQQWPCHFGDNQRFQLVPTDNGSSMYIVSKHSGQCLTVPGWDEWQELEQWDCGGGDHQKWYWG